MPMPRITQAPKSPTGPVAAASATSPPARTTFEAMRTPRPPRLSIVRPTHGPATAATSSEAENAAKNQERGMPRAAPMGSAKMAGR